MLKFKQFFLKKYATEKLEIQQKAFSLLIVDLFLIITTLLVVLTIENEIQRIIILILCCSLSGFPFLIRSGKYKLISTLTSFILMIAVTGLVFTQDFEHTYEIYFQSFLIICVGVVTSLIIYSKWQLISVLIIGAVGQMGEIFSRIYPAFGLEKIGDKIVDLVTAIFCYGTVCFVLIASYNRNRRLVLNAEIEAATNKERFNRLEQLVTESNKSISVGQELLKFAEETCSSIRSMGSQFEQSEQRIEELESSVKQMEADNQNIMQATDQVEQVSESQGSIISESSASIEEMTASMSNISKTASKRNLTIEKLLTTTQEALQDVQESRKSYTVIRESATSMQNIIKAIKGISSQTNLLAMNAAIEAAHAGDYGKGFAVVAAEIRKLAEDAATQTKQISLVIKSSVDSINKADTLNEQAVQIFGKIEQEVQTVAKEMSEIVAGMQELSAGTGEITQGVTQMIHNSDVLKENVRQTRDMLERNMLKILRICTLSGKVQSALLDNKNKINFIMDETEKVKNAGQIVTNQVEKLGTSIKGLK